MGEIIEFPAKVKVVLAPKSGPNIPDFVPRSFVGIEFPVMEKIPVITSCPTRIGYGYKIDKATAVHLIRKKSLDAARWIEEHPDIFTEPFIVINEEACLPEDFFLMQARFPQ